MTAVRFRQVYIEITNICNLDCSFCPGTRRQPATMDSALFTEIIKQVKPLTDRIYLHVMGEPLLHPEFSLFSQICAEHELPVAITTNGSMFNSSAADSLLNPIVRQVNISLHALQEDISEAERTERFEQIIEFTQRAFELRPELYINYRLWNLNFSNENLDSSCNGWLCRKIQDAFKVDIPMLGHSREFKSRRLINRLYLNVDTRFSWPGNEENPLNTSGFCPALTSQFAILVDGTVVPCCLDHDGIICLGNCREQSIDAILNSSRAKSMVAGFNRGKLVEKLCQKCSFCSRFRSVTSKPR